MKEDDYDAIERQVDFMRMHDRFAEEMNLFPTPVMSVFNDVAQYLNGDHRSIFRVLRSLRRIYDKRDVRWLIAQISENSHSRWHLKIERRAYSAMANGGEWIRTYERDQESNRIGLTFYELLLSGASAEEAYQRTREVLKLNLTDRTLKDRLKEFRAIAKRNGFSDSNAPFRGWLMGGYISKPKVTVAQISRRGRPKKGVADN